ncbi:DUF4368 domain-containing protein [Robertmurraya sp. FSL R5-0851]|uniref:DUF4368 domain-containing protein n=1 Tax=Robertmurraya sp. FSL R5-0851 TaxID=2921584 RepID=UPI0030F891B4
MEKKNEMLSMLESEQVMDNIDKLKQELLQFLNFDELTPEILHRLINRVDEKERRHTGYSLPILIASHFISSGQCTHVLIEKHPSKNHIL